MIPLLVRASCATPPPNGEECNDTVALVIPDWVWLAVLGGIALVVLVAVAAGRARRRRS